MLELLEALVWSTLEFAPALIFAALGAVLSERSGTVNVGVEGMMRVGAFAAAAFALVMPTPLAVLLGMAAGALFAAIHAVLCISWRSDQVISGMALNLVALAGITFLLESMFGPSTSPSIAQLGRSGFGPLAQVPLLRALSGHTALTWLAAVLALAFHLVLGRTPVGLRIRAVGEKPSAAATVGVDVIRLRYLCVIGSGALAGLGGAALSTATLDRFEHNMPAGLGFMAVAAMVFGRWSPLGAFGAAAFFAFGRAVQIGLESSFPSVSDVVPKGVLLALPYFLTLVVLTLQGKKSRAPAALGTPWEPEAR
ncbi:MAG: ABC transporter permease [Myxococcaceae bacterium]|nr:ABC transporter permease [Myxococcaceae bacterium]